MHNQHGNLLWTTPARIRCKLRHVVRTTNRHSYEPREWSWAPIKVWRRSRDEDIAKLLEPVRLEHGKEKGGESSHEEDGRSYGRLLEVGDDGDE